MQNDGLFVEQLPSVFLAGGCFYARTQFHHQDDVLIQRMLRVFTANMTGNVVKLGFAIVGTPG